MTIPIPTDSHQQGGELAQERPCIVPGCPRARYRQRSMCNHHAMRKHHYGDPLASPPQRSTDLTGQRFGLLVVEVKARVSHWQCRCDCGVTKIVRTWSLTSGRTTSCGAHPRRAEVITYSGMHMRLRADRGGAENYPCVDCGEPAAHWSYSHEDPNELQSKVGAYSTDPEHYSARCVPCHKRMDLLLCRSHNSAKGTR